MGAPTTAKRGSAKKPQVASKRKTAKHAAQSARSTRAQKAAQETAKRKAAFLAAFTERGIVTHAAAASGTSRRQVYEWYETDEAFAAAWDDAKEQATDALEAEAFRRGVLGVDRPVFQGGECVGVIREYSDTLLVLTLKANRPAKYRERSSVEVSGPNGGPVQYEDLTDKSDAELLAEEAAILRDAGFVVTTAEAIAAEAAASGGDKAGA